LPNFRDRTPSALADSKSGDCLLKNDFLNIFIFGNNKNKVILTSIQSDMTNQGVLAHQ
jgi:hypothetical protein